MYIATNNATSTLAGSLSAAGTSLIIQSADISKFPVVNHGGTGSDYSLLTLQNSAGTIEIVKVTRHDNGSSGFTIVRAQEGSSASTWNPGDAVACRLTAGVVNEAFIHPGVASAAHAATAISFAPTGNIAATTVQAAIAELESDSASGISAALATRTPLDGTGATGTWGINVSGTAASAPKLASTNWTVQEVAGVLYFQYGGVNKAKLDSSGNLTVAGNVTAYGTV